eukprot:739849_1
MIKSLFVVALLSIFIEAQEYELLVYQDAQICLFDRPTIESTGGNQGTSLDPCYSNIGTIAQIKDDYRDKNGKFTFRLTYYDNSVGPKDIVLEWSQTSWITDSQIEGADLSQIPTQNFGTSSGRYFNGLGRNIGASDDSFIDGTPGAIHGNWWCAVVAFGTYDGGIPAFNEVVAKRNKLLILVPEKCVMDKVCSDIDELNDRIDTLRDYLQGTDAAHVFNGDVIVDNKSVFDDLFEFSKTELLLLALNLITIVFGLFICWKGGLFSQNNKRGYAKVRQYYESDAVEKPINA